MAKLTVFEIHILRDDGWKIESIYDDRELAVMEGERMGRSPRYKVVRVVEETFDEETEKASTRTIYRSTNEQPPIGATEPPTPEVIEVLRRRRLSAGRTPPPPEVIDELRHRRRASSRTPPKKSMAKQILGKTFLFVAIIGAALGLVYVLNSII
ncbi:MAG: hypothetical protein E2O90_03010 [Alphaproteobacteria bacterium]|nr:hypothetical protein [Pseudomonadota bacterium]TDI67281.1 MAG: hypothetical protein E2O90_03010 [Alphaproteobacteria bacterium]